MLRELTRDDWLRILDLPLERVPRALILRGTRNLRHQYERHARLFYDNPRREGDARMLELALAAVTRGSGR